jgi:hypothetical protein
MVAGAMTRKLALAFWLLLFGASIALADDLIEKRTMGVVFREGVPHIYYSARDLIRRDAMSKLDSGLPQRIAVQHFVYAVNRSEPIAAEGHGCKVVYDLWQASYRVEYEKIGQRPEVLALTTRAEVLERCLVMRDRPLGEASDYQNARRMYVAALVQLNPLSTSTVARIRRWLARPRGEYNVEGKSFFGSFVSLFVNDRIGSAERVLRLRSQDFERP